MPGVDDGRPPLRSVAVVAAAALAVAAAPAAVLLGAPLALGAPHLVADVRWLVLRRRMPAALLVASAAATVSLIALRALEIAGHAPAGAARLEAAVAAAWVIAGVVAGRALALESVRPARWLPFVAVAGVLALAPTAPTRAAVVLLHNLVALALWVALFRPPRRAAVAVVGAVVVGVGLLAIVGPALAHALGLPRDRAFEAAAIAFAPSLAPAVATGALEAVLFLQLVHYAVWLVFVPAACGPRSGDRRSEIGLAALVALTPIGVAVALAAGGGPRAVRDAYLSLAVFHAYLELAAWAFVAARGDAPDRRVGATALEARAA